MNFLKHCWAATVLVVVSGLATAQDEVFDAVLFLQEQVQATYEVDGLYSTGEWDAPTAVGVATYLRDLQEGTGLGPEPPDGEYTPEFRAELAGWLETMDTSHPKVAAVLEVHQAMNLLTDRGILAPAVPFDPSRQELLATGVLVMANGFLWEWGDELIGRWIGSQHGPEAAAAFGENAPRYLAGFVERYPLAGMILNGLGVWISLGAVLAVIIARSNGGGFANGFKAGAFCEAVEGAIAFFGEVNTFGVADGALVLKFTAIMAVVSGITVGWIASSKSPGKTAAAEVLIIGTLASAVYILFLNQGCLQSLQS